jgi:2-dehydro-3-deoxy-D-arabinonate dehydratase
MEIVRYASQPGTGAVVGVRRGDRITPVTGVDSLAELLRLPLAELRATVEGASGATVGVADVLLLPPVDGGSEVWGAGVTYEISKWARVEEARERSIYERVYDAERPELFFKSVPWRVSTDGEPIGIRPDSTQDVPEPELCVVANAQGEIVGYLICNDVTARSIEGENPLYLTQAKVYAGSCALSAGIRPAWEIDDPHGLEIGMTVVRGSEAVWHQTTSTARMRRRVEELVHYLFLGDAFPDGVLLTTGTGLVPDMSFALAAGDRVDIEIDQVGTLSNPVVAGKAALAWLLDARTDHLARPRPEDRQP